MAIYHYICYYYFSLGLQIILKLPPTIKGIFSMSHIRTSSLRKYSFLFSCAAPYTASRHHSKLPSLLHSLNFKAILLIAQLKLQREVAMLDVGYFDFIFVKTNQDSP
jgi:hypothetical protein